MKPKILIITLICVFGAFFYLFHLIYFDSKEKAIDDLNSRQTILAKQAQTGIEHYFKNVSEFLYNASKTTHILNIDEHTQNDLDNILTISPEAVKAITRVDAYGKITATSPYDADAIGRDISNQNHIRKILKIHDPVVSDVFTAVQGYRAIALHVPVYSEDGFNGTIGFLIDFMALAERFIKGIKVGEAGYAWMTSREGIELYCPVPGHIGRSVFENSKDFPTIVSMAKKMVKGEQGVTTYIFDQIRDRQTEQVKKHAVYIPIKIVDSFWTIVVASSEEELLAGLKGFRDKIFFTLGLFVIITILFSYYIMKAWGISRYVSQLEHSEAALKESESRYRALFDFNPIQTIVVDNDGKITMFNFVKERLSGRIPSVGDLMYIDYADKHEINMHEKLIECIQTDNKKSFSELKYKDRYLNIHISPFSGGAIITSEDVTERKRMQGLLEQVRKMEAVGTLSGGVAHEFNNILAIILGNTELAMDDIPEYNPIFEFLLEVKNASIRGKEIVHQLLSYSHKTNHKRQAINISNVINESVKFLRASIPSSIEFEKNIADDAIAINGDKTQIHQLMINLCNNAAQSMEETGGKLKIILDKQNISQMHIFAGQQLEPGEYVRLIIEDTGQGIQPSILENIFDPFFTTKPVDKGSGLGLAVVYGIVKGHEGFIEMKSIPNKGTKVFCYFPITEEVPIDIDETSESSIEGHETIFFVDDEASLAKMVKQQLERLGYKVETTTDPSEVLEQFNANPEKYDLVITDMTMPKMTGDRLIQELKNIRADIKTIICTGYSKNMNEEKAAKIGATGYIMKPIDRKKLADTVRKVLDEAKR